MPDQCDARNPDRRWRCPNPVRFCARDETAPVFRIFACGKHLSAMLADSTTRYIVVRIPDEKPPS